MTIANLTTVTLEPDQDLIDMMRRLLASAESGELRALTYAAALDAGRHQIATAGDWGSAIAMVGAAELAKQYVMELALEASEDAE